MSSQFPTEGDPTDHISIAVNANPIVVRNDDDGMAIDEYFEAGNDTAIPRDYLSTGDTVNLPVTTRILVSKFVATPLTGGSAQSLMFPADPNRQALYITASVDTAYNVTSEPLGSVGGIGAFNSAGTNPQEFTCHTGAVWITVADNAPDVTFIATSVTV